MQILYWHLNRPRRSSFGGPVFSPPLLQRPTSVGASVHAYNSPLDHEDEMEMQEDDIMEIDDGALSTVFLLNVDHIIGEDGQSQFSLNDLGSLTTSVAGESCLVQGGVNFLQNGLPQRISPTPAVITNNSHGGETSNNISISTTTTNGPVGSKRKVANRDVDHVPLNERLLYNGHEDDIGCNTDAIVTKRPKLVINLYEESRGYSYGCQMSENDKDGTEVSHLIPYSENSLLRSVDNEEIPDILLMKGEDLLCNRGHAIAQINDFRRFGSSAAQPKPTSSNQILGKQNVRNKRCVVQEVILKPTTHSILKDFDRLIDKSIKDRKEWKFRRTKETQVESENESEDSEFEFEVDLQGSLEPDCDHLSYEQRLELEKELINRTSGSLCLDPSPAVGMIMNRIQFERFKWQPNQKNRLKDTYTRKSRFDNDDEGTNHIPLAKFSNFLQFTKSVRERSSNVLDNEPTKLTAMICKEYSVIEPPRHQEELMKLGQKAEPSTLRALPIDNYVKRIEEYILETERRKRPHTTKLSILQRSGMDCYFGELEMESFLDGPQNNKPGGVLKPGEPATATTKCQFELGSSRSVALYVKQFSDIFTEDGRRPCKITYQKVGQPQPQVLYTNSYKAAAAGGSTPTAPSSSASSAGSGTANANQSQTTTPPQVQPPPTQPPVQIVHPQPRTAQQQTRTEQSPVPVQGQVQPHVYTANIQNPPPTVNSSVNLNVNVNSNTGMTSQQILTRPQIVNVNLQQQQTMQGQNVRTGGVTQQQILQQRLLRLKQQQQQQNQNQQPQTALAKLLLTNMQPNSTGSRPITVAVQPQPQTPVMNNGNVIDSQQQITLNSQTLMMNPTHNQQGSQNVNVNVNTTPNLSVNLNTITLDGLLSGSSPVGNMSGVNTGSNLLSGRVGTAVSTGNAVNILRVGGGLSTGAHSLQRQLTMSTVSNGNVSILQTSQPQQRILINANSGQQIGSVTLHGNVQEVEEVSVPDLNTLLGNGTTSTVQLGQTQMITGQSGLSQLAAQTPNVDTHNVNLNLNVNLNSGTVLGGGDTSHSQIQTATQPPFLVFISPLRPMSLATSTGGNRHITSIPTVVSSASQSANTLSLNLGTVQSHQSHLVSHQIHDSSSMENIVTTLTPGNNIISIPNNSNLSNNSVVSSQNVTSSSVDVIDGVDSIFNALSEAIGPELGQKLDGISNTVMIGSTPYSVSVSSTNISSSQISPSIMSNSNSSNNNSKKDTSIITLSDLLGSPTAVSTNHGLSSLILNPQTTIMVSSSQSSMSSSSTSSSVLSSTPRLSALLAGSPSADSSINSRMVSNSPLTSPTPLTDPVNGGTLLDRLTASLTQGGGNSNQGLQQRVGGSRLNPIATATPSVVLEHPVLAATLTGQQQPQRGIPAYRQIAPAPTSSSASLNRKNH